MHIRESNPILSENEADVSVKKISFSNCLISSLNSGIVRYRNKSLSILAPIKSRFNGTTVRDSVFKLVCKVPNFAIKFELWIK
jgi:hypothetical protein